MYFFLVITTVTTLLSCSSRLNNDEPIHQVKTPLNMKESNPFSVVKTEDEWKSTLSSEQYYVLREAGTERPFTGKYNMHFDHGTYSCAGCGTTLFTSESKFDGHCGWPSFDREISEGRILKKVDQSHNMVRTELLCAKCGGHLGHLFDDGPTSTKLRYCINSLSLEFQEK